MSTLFTSAAMGLLSRTLQAFLYKYLSDVDVQRVEVPSFTDSSGWGIRLSNVQLREGTQLMTLPGKMNSNTQESKETDVKPEESAERAQDEQVKEEQDPQRTCNSTNDKNGDEEMSNGTERSTASRSRWFSWSVSSGMNDADDSLLRSGLQQDEAGKQSPDNAESATGCSKDPSMVLKLGKGGKIGVLDVRLVGKSVHVLIEDAELVLEVVESQDSPTGKPTEHEKKDVTSEKRTPKASSGESDSVGDRVLAENAIAKILASIPNLFLRDIRLQIMLPNANDKTKPTCVEVNVELLSVTDGADFLMNFGATRGGEAEDQSQSSETSFDEDDAEDVMASETSENEFFTKRIRTGRGLEGGITIRVLTEKDSIPKFNTPCPLWARERWHQDTNAILLRCSGVDLTARIFLGTRAEASKRKQEVVEYDELDLDSLMFGGCDYVVPGPPDPRPSLPLEPVLHEEPGGSWESTNEPAKLVKQANGIQVFSIPSHFHQVARGFKPHYCSQSHPPHAQCFKCWKPSNDSCTEHPLDNLSPLGGLVCQLSIREPLEINIDRTSLDSIGSLISLFTKPKPESPDSSDLDVSDADPLNSTSRSHPRTRLNRVGSSRRSQKDIRKRQSVNSSFDDSYRSMDSTRSKQNSTNDTSKEARDDGTLESFPSYMMPEKVSFMGVYISEVRFRVHILKDHKSIQLESGTGFCYWDARLECITLDHQRLTAQERPFQDVRLGLGFCKLVENRGTESSTIASIGKKATMTDSASEKTMPNSCPWPSSASAMLDLAAPSEFLAQKSNLQLRYFSVTDATSIQTKHHKAAVVFVESPEIDTLFSIKDKVICVIVETIRTFQKSKSTKSPSQSTSLMHYKLSVNDGFVKLCPMIDASFPPLTVVGEISSEAGFSIETAFNEVKLKYGKCSAPKASDVGLSLQQLAVLPETVRFRILLFLKDLSPLETALGLPRSQNSFLQCRAVNKAIVDAAHRRRRIVRDVHEVNGHSRLEPSQAEMFRAELMALDDESLSELFGLYHRSKI